MTAPDQPLVHVLLVHYDAEPERITALLEQHRRWLREQYDAGRFLLSGPREPRTGGVILARGEDPAQLADLVATDPFVLAGAAHYELLAFRALWGPLAEAFTVP